MRYLDTRGLAARPRTFSEAVLEGIAPGGGLFLPEAADPGHDYLAAVTLYLRVAKRHLTVGT